MRRETGRVTVAWRKSLRNSDVVVSGEMGSLRSFISLGVKRSRPAEGVEVAIGIVGSHGLKTGEDLLQ
jgi:hypothetical protein